MAVNSGRSMNMEFNQGSIDRTYIQLTPDRGVVENPPVERYAWPTYGNCDLFPESPFLEGHVRRAQHPHEIKTTGDGDTRF
jgi:hypothetical protein